MEAVADVGCRSAVFVEALAMTARSHSRGHAIEHDGQRWVYSDTRRPETSHRPCRRCKRRPTPDGHDACSGTIPAADVSQYPVRISLSDVFSICTVTMA